MLDCITLSVAAPITKHFELRWKGQEIPPNSSKKQCVASIHNIDQKLGACVYCLSSASGVPELLVISCAWNRADWEVPSELRELNEEKVETTFSIHPPPPASNPQHGARIWEVLSGR